MKFKNINKHIFLILKKKVTGSTVPCKYINNYSPAITHEVMVSFNQNAFILRASSVSVVKLTDRKSLFILQQEGSLWKMLIKNNLGQNMALKSCTILKRADLKILITNNNSMAMCYSDTILKHSVDCQSEVEGHRKLKWCLRQQHRNSGWLTGTSYLQSTSLLSKQEKSFICISLWAQRYCSASLQSIPSNPQCPYWEQQQRICCPQSLLPY